MSTWELLRIAEECDLDGGAQHFLVFKNNDHEERIPVGPESIQAILERIKPDSVEPSAIIEEPYTEETEATIFSATDQEEDEEEEREWKVPEREEDIPTI